MSNVKYSEQFKKDAVKKFELHGSISWVCDVLGVQPNSLRKWIREYEPQLLAPTTGVEAKTQNQ